MRKEKKEHISFSQMNMAFRCGEQYRRRYVLGEIIQPSGALVRGSGCHKAEAKNFQNKIDQDEFLPVEAVESAFSDYWESEKFNIAWNEDDLDGDSPTKASGKMKDSGIRLINVFHKEQLINCEPVSLEQDFEVTFEGGYPPLIGYIDRIDKGDVIAEQKFVGKSPKENEISTMVQVTTYDLGFRTKYGRKPKKLMAQWSIDTKTPKTVMQDCPPRDDETIQRFMNRLETFLDMLQKGVFPPCTADSWCCSKKWCGYWESCKVKP